MDVHALDLILAALLAVGGYLIKRWVEASNQQLEKHVTDCNERNKEVRTSISVLSDKVGQTAENVASLEGAINAVLDKPAPRRKRR